MLPAGVIAGVAGVVLVISMFLPWFGPNDAQEQARFRRRRRSRERFGGQRLDEPDLTENAWQSFGFVDLVLLVTGVLERHGRARTRRPTRAAGGRTGGHNARDPPQRSWCCTG